MKSGTYIQTDKLPQDLVLSQYVQKEGENEEVKKLFDLTIKRYDNTPYIARIGETLLSNNDKISLEKGTVYKLEILNKSDMTPAVAKGFIFNGKESNINEYNIDATSVLDDNLIISTTIVNEQKTYFDIGIELTEPFVAGFICNNCDNDPEKTRLAIAQRTIKEETRHRGASIYMELETKEIVINLSKGASGDKYGDAKWNKTTFSPALRVDFGRLQFDSDCITDESIILVRIMDNAEKDIIKNLIKRKSISDIRVQEFKLSNPELFTQITSIIENPAIYHNENEYINAIDAILFLQRTSSVKLYYPASDVETVKNFTTSPKGVVNLYIDNLNQANRNFSYPVRTFVTDPSPDEQTINKYIQQNYTRILAHELNHLYFQMKNPMTNVKWSILRNDISKLTDSSLKHELENKLCDHNSSGNRSARDCKVCSDGPGHERHNPEGHECCCIEFDY
jgi:hypothetical protein